jgi:hypothetical protein
MPGMALNQGRIQPCVSRKDYLSERKSGRILQKRAIPVEKPVKPDII